MKVFRIKPLILLLSLTLWLFGCSRHQANGLLSENFDNPEVTGLLKTNQRQQILGDYLIPNPSAETDHLKKQVTTVWKEKKIEQNSIEFSSSIQNVLAKKNLAHNQIEFVFEFNGKNINGARKMIAQLGPVIENKRPILEVSQNDLQIEGSSQCLDSQCQQINLSLSFMKLGQVVAHTGIHISFSDLWIKPILPKHITASQYHSFQLTDLIALLQETSTYSAEEFQVIGGISKTSTKIDFRNQEFCLRFENSETDKAPFEVFLDCSFSKHPIEGHIVSNFYLKNSTGERTLKTLLQLKDKRFTENRLYLELSRREWAANVDIAGSTLSESQPANLDLLSLTKSYYFPVNLASKNEKSITLGFEKLRQEDWVKKAIQSAKNKRRQGLQNFFTNMKAQRSELLEICREFDTPCTTLYITLIESSLFSHKPQHFEPSGLGTSCEVGPWQFTYSTAGDYFPKELIRKVMYKDSLSVLTAKNKCSKKIPLCSEGNDINCYSVDENDPRQYFIPATKAALKYLKVLFKTFPENPGLAILSYNRGAGFVGRALSLEVAQDLEYGLNQLVEKRVAGSKYIKKFLAYYFIGAEPLAHGFDLEQPSPLLPCELKYNPSSGQCG